MEMSGAQVESRTARAAPARPPLLRDAGSDGNVGKLAAYDVKTMKEVWSREQRARSSRRADDGSGVGFVGDLDRVFRAFDVKTGETLWQTRLGTSVQGYPGPFTAGGRQYIAVTTGLGGGSPRPVRGRSAPTSTTAERQRDLRVRAAGKGQVGQVVGWAVVS
jgi:outer membrane protein assembly factor BamB